MRVKNVGLFWSTNICAYQKFGKLTKLLSVQQRRCIYLFINFGKQHSKLVLETSIGVNFTVPGIILLKFTYDTIFSLLDTKYLSNYLSTAEIFLSVEI